MKRYVVILISLFILLFIISVAALGNEEFYIKESEGYLILLPDGKTNKYLSTELGSDVYKDSSLNQKAEDSSKVGTGSFIYVSGKKCEIIVKGDIDGDGAILNDDVSFARFAFSKPQISVRYKNILDIDDDGRYTTRDYLLIKAHFLDVKKISDSSFPSVESEDTSVNPEESSEVDPDWINQCTVSLSDGNISVDGEGATVSGKTVSITAGGEYTLNGKLSDGMILVNSTEKVKLRLEGVNISNSSGPAILFANASKAYITIANGSVNYLSDGKSYSNGKGTIFSEADLEIKGKGTLYVKSNYRHAICCDEDLVIENGIIIVEGAVKDGIHAKKSIEITGGDITVENCDGDAFDCEGTNSGTKGTISILGGKITVKHSVGDGINGFGDITIASGVLNIVSESDCIKSDSYIKIGGAAMLNLNGGSDGINSAKGITVSGGNISVKASDYTLKSDADITVTGGTLTLEGVREKIYAIGALKVSGGTIRQML